MTAYTRRHRNGAARFDTLEPHQVIRLRQWPVHRPSRRVASHFAIWAHVAYLILVILAVLIVTAVLGYWSPAS